MFIKNTFKFKVCIKNKKLRDIKGQNLLEYTMVIGLLTAAMITMGLYIQRGAQGLIRTVADQIGVQNQADQSFNSDSTGFVIDAATTAAFSSTKTIQDTLGTFNYSYDDTTHIVTNQLTDGGFTEQSPP